MFPNTQTITIWDKCGTIPEGEFGFNWSGYKDVGGGRSLLRLLEERSDELRRCFFQIRADFLSILSQSLSSYPSSTKVENKLIFMSLLVEGSTYKSPCLLDFFRLLAFDQELKTMNAKNLRYVGPQAS
ncbi:uncharacterized protein METZ01_LOCUS434778, partial [marine metagenome]